MKRWPSGCLYIIRSRKDMMEKVVGLTCAKEKSNEWEDHLLTKFFIEKEHPKHDPDRNNAQDRHSPLDNLQNLAKLPDIPTKSVHKITRETVGPERVFALSECNLQPHTLRLVSITLEEVECVFKGRRAALDAIVHP